MNVAVYYPDYDRLHFEVLQAFAKGVPGATLCRTAEFDEASPPDVAVVFGVRKHAVPRSNDRGRIIDAMGPERVIVLETGYVHRRDYFACGWGGLNGRADFRNADSPPDRWEKLGVELEPWRLSQGHVLVVGQVPWDASVQNSDHLQWVSDIANALKEYGFGVCVTPHPLGPKYVVEGIPSVYGTMEDKLKGAEAVVTYNSNSAVEAVIKGIPTVAMDCGSMAWPVTRHVLHKMCVAYTPVRDQWAANLAYAQWNLDELRSGEAWEHINKETQNGN